jgi:hypothetical protein
MRSPVSPSRHAPARRSRRASPLAWSCLGLLAGLALASPAHAQVSDSDPAETARVHLGRFSFTPAVVCSTGYDSNPYREPGRGSTWESYAIPQVEGWLSDGTNRLAFWGAAETVHFSNMVGATNWQAGGRFERAGTTFRPYVNYNLRNTNANPTGFEVGKKSMRIEGDLSANLDVRLGQVSLSLLGRSTNTNWAADAIYQTSNLRESLNRRSSAFGAGIGYALTPLTSIEFTAQATRDRFVYSPLRDGDGVLLLTGVNMSSPAVIQGNAWVGWRTFHSPTDGAADFNGPVAYGSLIYSSPSGGALSFRLSRDREFSYDKSLAYYVSTSLNLTGILPLSTSWRATSFVATTTLNYRAAGTVGQGPLQRVNEFGGALGYNVGQVSVVGVTAEWARALGSQGWREVRVVAFLTYGSERGSYQRLDRPIPFSR